MRAAVVGCGYVGLANAAFLASVHYEVAAYDIDEKKIASLQAKAFPIEEKKLSEVLQKNRERILYTSSLKDLAHCDAYFLCLPTPAGKDGAADLSAFNQAVTTLQDLFDEGSFVFIRSTVPLGTGSALAKKLASQHVSVVSYPEFLAEGHVYEEEETPSRFVLGIDDDKSLAYFKNLRKKSLKEGIPCYAMSHESAELTKYASNGFLALKISYLNELSRLAERSGADIGEVALAFGADPRIGHALTKVGVGFGGSCLPKDLQALGAMGEEKGLSLLLPEAATAVNLTQPLYFLKKMDALLPLPGKKIALLGLAYKAGTSDIRNALSLSMSDYLLKDGAILSAYDPSPLARESFQKAQPAVNVVSTLKEAIKGADALLILSEEKEFAQLEEAALLPLMVGRWIFDGRNLYELGHFHYFNYASVGRKTVLTHD